MKLSFAVYTLGIGSILLNISLLALPVSLIPPSFPLASPEQPVRHKMRVISSMKIMLKGDFLNSAIFLYLSHIKVVPLRVDNNNG